MRFTTLKSWPGLFFINFVATQTKINWNDRVEMCFQIQNVLKFGVNSAEIVTIYRCFLTSFYSFFWNVIMTFIFPMSLWHIISFSKNIYALSTAKKNSFVAIFIFMIGSFILRTLVFMYGLRLTAGDTQYHVSVRATSPSSSMSEFLFC